MMFRSYGHIAVIAALLLLIANATAAQSTQKIQDSLLQALPTAKDDSNKVLALCQLSTSYFQTDPAKGVVYGEKALALSRKLNYKNGLAQSNLAIGRCYAIQSSYAQALKYFQDGLGAAQVLKQYKDEARLLSSMGNVYRSTQEYDKALDYFSRAIKAYGLAGEKNVQNVMNNIGSLYFELGRFRESIPYYLEGVRMEKADKANPADLATLYNNLGGAYTGIKYDSALYYLKQALQLNELTGNLRSKMYSLIAIGFIYLQASVNNARALPASLLNKQANLANAMHYERQALELATQLGIVTEQVNIYYNIMNILAAQGNYKEAISYLPHYDSLHVKVLRSAGDKEIARVEAEFKVQLTTDSLKYQNLLKDSQIKKRDTQRNYLIILVIFVGTVSALLINRQKLKHTQKIKIAEAERLRIEELATQKLEDFAKSIQEKNQLIEVITAEIEKYKEQPGWKADADYTLLNELQQSILLTDAQWESFKETFDKVHIGYRHRLRDKMLDLTPAEIRFVLLSKLKLSLKEMAGMLGVSTPAMRANKYRLMKKLNIDDDVKLDELIHSI